MHAPGNRPGGTAQFRGQRLSRSNEEHPRMIMTRSPLRISLGGGGTDLPSYYEDHSGFLIAAAIDKYVYILMHERFVPRVFLKYSQMEEVDRIEDIHHPL